MSGMGSDIPLQGHLMCCWSAQLVRRLSVVSEEEAQKGGYLSTRIYEPPNIGTAVIDSSYINIT